jgi:ComF family protein
VALCGLCAFGLRRRPIDGFCARCGERAVARSGSRRPLRCDSSHAGLRGLRFAASPLRYARTGGALVRRFKLDRDLVAGRWLGRAMAEDLQRRLEEIGFDRLRRTTLLLCPVPLHAVRRRRRGFDQALWLADFVGARCGIEVLAGALRRTRPTLPQGDPRVTSRERNVGGAFALGWPAPRRLVGRDVVLVDDVWTSGATARACARVLLDAGARTVALLAAARARIGEDDRVPGMRDRLSVGGMDRSSASS